MRIHLGYPDREQEIQILREQKTPSPVTAIEPVTDSETVRKLQAEAMEVTVKDDLLHYIARIVEATRNTSSVSLGCSTRGALALRRCAQARAYIEGRDYVIPDDIKALAIPVIAHRLQIARSFDFGAGHHHEDEEIVREIISEIEIAI